MSRDRVAILIACVVVVVPRLLRWGEVPVVVDGDEAAFFAFGIAEYANRSPIWSFGPNSLPNAHLWLMGLADALLGRDIWSARLVTALFGAAQAAALVAASARLAGGMGALTTAAVLCLPMELHFERLAMCNVWTTATWSMAFALAVLAPWRIWSSAAIGVLLAAGWYGYQSSRLVPVIVALPLLVLLLRATWRQWLAIGVGGLSSLLALAPLLYGFWLMPTKFSGRATDTSWLSANADPAAVQLHLWATLSAFTGTGFDLTGFFPYHLPLFPLLVTLLAVVGLAAARSLPLALCLAVWIASVMFGNFIRNIPIYSCVLVCAVPAVAAAAGLSARWLGVAAPLLAALAVFPLTAAYFELGAHVPQSRRFAMAHLGALRAVPHDAPLLVGGGVPCDHGFNRLHRPCFNLEDPDAPRPPGAWAVIFPDMAAVADSIPGERRTEDWYGIPVIVISPPPAAPPPA